MTLTDGDLIEILRTLTDAERRALAEALQGNRTATASAILRFVKSRLKRRARAGSHARRKPRTKKPLPHDA